jgi:hypothetical protein
VVRPGDGGLYLSVDRRGQCYVSRLGLALLGVEPCGGVVEVAVSVEVEVVRLRRPAAGGVGHVLYGGRFTCRWLAQLVARDGERVWLVLWSDGDALVGELDGRRW